MIRETRDRKAGGTGVACLFYKTRVLGYVITLSVACFHPPSPHLL